MDIITCNHLIDRGIQIRYATTLITILLLSVYKPSLSKYILYIVPLLLLLLDSVDAVTTINYKFNGKYNGCKELHKYQIADKICDVISYILILFIIDDPILVYLVIYRMLGVIIFGITKNGKSLIIFFDFVKEYLIYKAIFGDTYTYIYPLIIGKICFEYYFHTIHNKHEHMVIH